MLIQMALRSKIFYSTFLRCTKRIFYQRRSKLLKITYKRVATTPLVKLVLKRLKKILKQSFISDQIEKLLNKSSLTQNMRELLRLIR